MDAIVIQELGRQPSGLKEVLKLLYPQHFVKVYLSHTRVSWRRGVLSYEDTSCDLMALHH